MLLTLLFANTANFALAVLSTFVFFTCGLLFFDSWRSKRTAKMLLLRSAGFFLLASASVFHATGIDMPMAATFFQIIKIIGLGFVFLSLFWEPILHLPSKAVAAIMIPLPPVLYWSLVPISAVLMLLIAAIIFRKATEGLEKQLKPAGFAFLFLASAEMLSIHGFFAQTPVAFWAQLCAEFGPVWSLEHLLETVGLVLLAAWIWGYIRFRIQLQLFAMTFGLVLTLFLVTTVFYSFLLLRNLETDALAHLKTDLAVLQYSLESLQERTVAQAQVIAQDSEIQQAFIKNDRTQLSQLSTAYLQTQHTSTLMVASASGEVIIRGEDAERRNESLIDNNAFVQAMQGTANSSVTYREGVNFPEINVLAAVPMRDGNQQSGEVIGVVITGFTIDNAFVDGVKKVTGLDTTVFGKNKRAATTFIAPDGKLRFVGTLETNAQITQEVLLNGNVYIGKAQLLNQPFYTAYAPLRNNDKQVIGMLSVGKLQNTLTDAARRSIELTFLGSVVLMGVSVIPIFFFSRFLAENLEA